MLELLEEEEEGREEGAGLVSFEQDTDLIQTRPR